MYGSLSGEKPPILVLKRAPKTNFESVRTAVLVSQSEGVGCVGALMAAASMSHEAMQIQYLRMGRRPFPVCRSNGNVGRCSIGSNHQCAAYPNGLLAGGPVSSKGQRSALRAMLGEQDRQVSALCSLDL